MISGNPPNICPDPEECPIYSVFDWHKGDLFKGCGWIKSLPGTL
jgi:hypothetical protein